VRSGRTQLMNNNRNWTYWQALFRFGLPFILLFRVSNYFAYRLRGANRAPYPWILSLVHDMCMLAVVSALWWGFKREMAGRRDHNQVDKQRGTFERCVESVIHWCLRGANYWQAVIRFGLPVVAVFLLVPELFFIALTGSHGAKFLVLSILRLDLPAVLILSTAWWALMRLVSSQRRGRAPGP
jgi:hypothetical protein